MTDALHEKFVRHLEQLDIALSERQLAQFETYYRLLIDWNERMNLTGITERDAVYEKHFYDSLTLTKAVSFTDIVNMADIGSGAGFPSIPVAIVFPHLRLTIVDSLAKRIGFLEEVVKQLELRQVVCLHGRAEDAGRSPEHRDRYALVTARAVARLAALNELCLPFVRPNGLFVAMKGANVAEELEESRFSAMRLNAELRGVTALALPSDGAERHLITIGKLGATPPLYPRKAGVPLKTPLIRTAAQAKK